MRGYFLGRFSEGPDVVSPAVPSDSPRIPINRQSMKELEADRVLRQLTDKIVADANGNTWVESRLTRTKPTHRILGPAPDRRVPKDTWKLPDGTIAAYPVSCRARLAKKVGWILVGPVAKLPGLEKSGDIDERIDIGEGQTMSMREKYEREVDSQARDANSPRQRVGRRVIDGEVARTYDGDDSPVSVPHGERQTMATLVESVKPKDGEP